MVNPYAGEVALIIDGQKYVMRLTLGALASLEARLESDSLVDLVSRFEGGAQKASDIVSLIVAGLQGGGWTGDERTLMQAEIEGGIVAASRAAALLLTRAFALPDEGVDGQA